MMQLMMEGEELVAVAQPHWRGAVPCLATAPLGHLEKAPAP